MTIYAVTKGEHEDYRICTLTTNKTKADRLAEIFSDKMEPACVEEFEDSEGEELRVLWWYRLYGRTVEPRGVSVKGIEEGVYKNIHDEICGVYVYAPDAKTAKEKALDMTVEYWTKQKESYIKEAKGCS